MERAAELTAGGGVGTLQRHIAARMPLHNMAAAHALVEQDAVAGNVVLTVAGAGQAA